MADNIYRNVLRGLSSQVEHQGEVVVIGLGRFGSALATTLVEMGHEVLGVDADLDVVQDLSGVLTHVAQADTTNEKALLQLGLADAVTVVVCIGTDVESSVLTTAALVDLEVPNIWAKAITEPHGRILKRVGAHNVVFPEAEMGSRVAHLVTGRMIEYYALDDDFVMIETLVPRWLAGRTLGETNLRSKRGLTVVCIKPEGGSFTYAERATVLGPNDLIVVAGHRGDVEKFAAADSY